MKNKRNILWILSSAIILLSFALVLFCRKSLPAELPLHISPDGSYADTMQYTRLFLYPLTSLVFVVLLYLVTSFLFKIFPKLNDPDGIRLTLIDITACCIPLIILSSVCVSLTMGRVHFFMYAEPVIFLVLVAAIVIGEIRIHKKK